MCALNAILFWGGWLPPVDWAPLYYVPGIIWLFIKMSFFFFCFGWVKATVPRYRYDQLMRLGWKIFLPISLIWVFLVSGYLMVMRPPCPSGGSGWTVYAPLEEGAYAYCHPVSVTASGERR
jgi:NADH-quinone oxidoreductase subunit H